MHPDGKLFGPFFDTLPLRETCWNLVVHAEEERGRPFEYVAFGRVDYFFFAMPPPYAAMRAVETWLRDERLQPDAVGSVERACWVPTGEDLS